MSSNTKKGFVLVFALVFLSLALIVALAQASSLLAEFRAAGREGRSLRALMAADAAVACVKFYHQREEAFDTSKPVASYACGDVGDFTAGGINEGECAEHTYTFTLDQFDNGACVDVAVTTIPVEFMAGPELVSTCDIAVEARGKDSCAAGAGRAVERVRTGRF